jgi:DNA polymerase I-like protein with 3'-5' exonuclease and polymerase domains
VEKILPELDRDNRIRTNFNLTFTTSGRLSSSGKFNAQQIPRDDPIIKGCIKAPAGYKIVSQDLTTAEMYYAAVLSGDKNLQQVFSSGGDFHSTIAKMVFNLPCHVDEVKNLYKSMRQSAKAISFGILYGSGANKVSQTVSKATGESYPVEQARDDIKQYFTKFNKLKNWLDTRKAFIEQNGYTYSFFGRKRRLPNVFSSDKGIAAHEVRSGINAEVQSLASDVNLLGAMRTANEIKERGLDAQIFMLVHDSIVALVKEEQVEQYCEVLKRNTQHQWGCEIPNTPIGVDQDIGDDYSFGHFDEVYGVTGDNLARI